MLEEGYAAVSSRRVAKKASIKSQIVHYYFPSMEDLFLTVYRNAEARYVEGEAQALSSARPLEALWANSLRAIGNPLTTEFLALANHRKKIKQEVAKSAKLARRRQTEALKRVLRGQGVTSDVSAPMCLAMLITAISRLLASDSALGISDGRREIVNFVQQHIRQLESRQLTKPASS
jgi:AcrR family transcriptional regulator